MDCGGLTESRPASGRLSIVGYSTLIEDPRGGVPQPLLSNYYYLTLYTTSSLRGIALVKREQLLDCAYSITYQMAFVNKGV